MTSPNRLSRLIAIAWIALLAGLACHSGGVAGFFATRFAEPKTPHSSRTELARAARDAFWNALYDADYGSLPRVRMLLTAAYLENPRDPDLPLLLAHAHLWTLAERTRLEEIEASITDHAILADRYFGEALVLRPDDARIHGWQGAVKLALGDLHRDERSTREGYYQLLRGAREYPEFNLFSAAYPLSQLPRDNPRFDEGVEYTWDTLEACIGGDFDREAFAYGAYMPEATERGVKRVCWSTQLVPHNFEGFFLNMGDMLAKQGSAEEARRAYETARLSPSYETWRYADVLDERLEDLDARVALFARATGEHDEPEIMFNSPYACVGCHAR